MNYWIQSLEKEKLLISRRMRARKKRLNHYNLLWGPWWLRRWEIWMIVSHCYIDINTRVYVRR
jgi:hypothetical protein